MAKKKWRKWLDSWLNDWRLAFSGLALATKNRNFLIVGLVTFLIFGTLLNLLSGGIAAFDLMAAVDFPGKLKIIFDAFLALFGVGRNFLDWLLYFLIALLQAALVGLIALVWKKRTDALKKSRKNSKNPKSPETPIDPNDPFAGNSDDLQRAGLAAGLAVLGSGCPTCGTTLLAPLIGTVFGSGGFALAGKISGLLTVLSILLALFALKKIGKEAYTEIVAENYQKKSQSPAPKTSKSNPERKTHVNP